jgi:phosphatidylethanolamine-binding protein (PEBP) family uncharacterized protein
LAEDEIEDGDVVVAKTDRRRNSTFSGDAGNAALHLFGGGGKGKAHRYFFKLYALDVSLDLPSGATKAQLEGAMKGHILSEGQLMGTYKR